MTWNEYLADCEDCLYYGQTKTNIVCPKCGKNIYLDNTVVLTSYPAKYRYWCSCGWQDCAPKGWTHGGDAE